MGERRVESYRREEGERRVGLDRREDQERMRR